MLVHIAQAHTAAPLVASASIYRPYSARSVQARRCPVAHYSLSIAVHRLCSPSTDAHCLRVPELPVHTRSQSCMRTYIPACRFARSPACTCRARMCVRTRQVTEAHQTGRSLPKYACTRCYCVRTYEIWPVRAFHELFIKLCEYGTDECVVCSVDAFLGPSQFAEHIFQTCIAIALKARSL